MKRKPTKGQRQFLAQNAKAQRKLLAMQVSPRKQITDAVKEKFAKLQNWYHKMKFLRGKHTPHQGKQEKARRVRQMAERKCINPEAWT